MGTAVTTVRARYWAVALVAALVVLTDTTARATLMIELGLEELVLGSDAIVHGVVERTGTQMATAGSATPYSVARLRVREWLGGDGGATVTLREPGAYWRGGGSRIDGAPSYRVGEEVIVFLAYDVNDFYRTYSMVQGKFVVRREGPAPALVERDLRAVTFLRWLSPGAPPPPDAKTAEREPSRVVTAFEPGARTPSEPLELFLTRIRALAGARP
jgi:hypothetical protein